MFTEDYLTSRGHADRFAVTEVDDSQDAQYHKVEGFSDEKFSKVIVVYPHGFSAHPLPEANLWGFAQGGSRDRLCAFGGEHPDKRPRDLPQGASVLYDSAGNVLRMFVDKVEFEGKTVPLDVFGFTKIRIRGKDDVAIGVEGGRWIRMRPGRVDLGLTSPDETAQFQVVTTGGPSAVVFAKID